MTKTGIRTTSRQAGGAGISSDMINHPTTRRTRLAGFSLIELMVVVTILGIIATIAIPQFREYVLQSRRSQAKSAIEEIRTLQYEFFQNYNRYGSRAEIGYPAVTESGYYNIAVVPAGLQFSASATATGNQIDDLECRVFSINSVATLLSFDSDGNQTFDCW